MRCQPAYREPRALWESFFVNNDGLSEARVASTKEHWFNGSRFPITLTSLIVSPLNYPTVSGGTGYGSCAQIMNASARMSVRFSSRFAREALPIIDLPAEPRGEPSMRYSGTTYAAGLFGVSRWDFDHAYNLSDQGSVQFGLSSWVPELRETVTDPAASIMFYESGDWMLGGQARLQDQSVVASTGGAPWPAGSAPLASAAPADACGVSGGGAAVWPAVQNFSATRFRQQGSSRSGGGSLLSGFAVAVDQIAHDDDNAAVFPGEIMAPFAQRLTTRCRTRAGGTGEWWWRPGAPLVLVTPTIGVGSIYPLEVPFTLAPGDGLHIEVEIAAPANVVHFGVSLCGYAEIS